MPFVVFWPSDVLLQSAEDFSLIGWTLQGAYVVVDALPKKSLAESKLPQDLALLPLEVLSWAPLALSAISTSEAALLVRYRPPNAKAHRMLSMTPFSFESDKTRERISIEDEVLSNAKAKLSRLDFSLPSSASGIDLEAVVTKAR
jgi:hypothetical protein